MSENILADFDTPKVQTTRETGRRGLIACMTVGALALTPWFGAGVSEVCRQLPSNSVCEVAYEVQGRVADVVVPLMDRLPLPEQDIPPYNPNRPVVG